MDNERITIDLSTIVKTNESIDEMQFSLLTLLDEVKGMHTLLHRFEEDTVMNSYNVGKDIDPDEYIETLENIFPLMVRNYEHITEKIEQLTGDLDRCSLVLAKGV